jgi:hypothetical protein
VNRRILAAVVATTPALDPARTFRFAELASGRSVLRTRGRRLLGVVAVVALAAGAVVLSAPSAQAWGWFEVQSLDGRGNNRAHPDWGQAGTPYARTAPAWYADGHSAPVAGPNSRYVSNRIFNDSVPLTLGPGTFNVDVNIFSETQASQWGWVWGQFLDHTFGLRQGALASQPHGESATIPVDSSDPFETNPVTAIPFTRSAPAPGTGVTNPRQQINTESSYIDAASVYGTTQDRLEWLREGPVDGDMSNNGARLLLPDRYLPVRGSRGDPSTSPDTELSGALAADSSTAVVTGDPRGNSNAPLTALHTLFAREHNRIVGLLPSSLSEETKFQIARRVVIAEMQYITYREFLPAMGIHLPEYRGYDPSVNATLSTEFATAAYRVHSMIHGELRVVANADRYTPADLDAIRAQRIEIRPQPDGKTLMFLIKLTTEQSNPALVRQLQLGPLLQGISLLPQYKNDELIDLQLRSVLCPPGVGQPACVIDLGAIDLERGRDHGLASYNNLRRAYGLPPRTSFTGITGESTESFPSDPLLTPGNEINDVHSLDYTSITNLFGSDLAPINAPNDPTAVSFTRRTALAARLKASYGSVDRVDALVGMMSEPHLPGSQFGELQQAIWTRQFQQLRDGDRFYYANQDRVLDHIREAYGIDYRQNLGDLVATNTDIPRSALPGNVFFVNGQIPPTGCRISYTVDTQTGTDSGTFTATLKVSNTGHRPIDAWVARYRYGAGQRVTEVRDGVGQQSGTDVPISNTTTNARIAPGQTRTVGITGTWTGSNPSPTSFNLNTTQCSSG